MREAQRAETALKILQRSSAEGDARTPEGMSGAAPCDENCSGYWYHKFERAMVGNESGIMDRGDVRLVNSRRVSFSWRSDV